MATTETIEKELYKGDVKLIFYPNSHRYKLADVKGWLTSVTAATGVIDKSKILMKWATDLTKKFLEERLGDKDTMEIGKQMIDEATSQHTIFSEKALNIGNLVHDFAEKIALYKLDKGEKPELPMEEAAVKGCKAFLTWVKENDITFIAAERFAYSKKKNYVGTADIMFMMGKDKTVHVGDYKTSKAIYGEYSLQVAAYKYALEEESGKKLGNSYIIRFDKESGEFEAKEMLNYDRDIKGFLAALALKEIVKELDAEQRKEWKAKQAQ